MNMANGDVSAPQALLSSITAQAIWDQRVLGFSVGEIGRQTGLSVERVGELLVSHHQQRRSSKTEGVDFYRDLALARAEALIRVYLQTALRGSITVERLRAGEPVAEEDVDHPLRCACLVLSLLRFQSELLGLRAGEVYKTDKAGPEGVLSWLRTQTEFIEQAVREAPRDIAVLPTGQLDCEQNPATKMKIPRYASASAGPRNELCTTGQTRWTGRTPPLCRPVARSRPWLDPTRWTRG